MGTHRVLLDLPPPLGVHRVTPASKEKGGDECAEGWGGVGWTETGMLCPRVRSDWRSVLTDVAVRNPLGFLLSSLVLNEAWENWAGEVEESSVLLIPWSQLAGPWVMRFLFLELEVGGSGGRFSLGPATKSLVSLARCDVKFATGKVQRGSFSWHWTLHLPSESQQVFSRQDHTREQEEFMGVRGLLSYHWGGRGRRIQILS